ncbi:MAG: ligase-associated damage response endonuclease PdeM [Bacteroidota bacterium]|jgi:DNA ligase-associated metallophosphoesterase
MQSSIQHIIANNTFWLSPQRCIYWEEEKALILSDLHFGKTGHFRKNGIAVPQHIYKEDLQRLIEQVVHFNPKKIIAVGDLFHSKENKELELFAKWRNDFHAIDFILVKGNHDILPPSWYEQKNLTVKEGFYQINEFGFVHDPNEFNMAETAVKYSFSGHLHPAVSMKGLGKQQLSFPCFHFTKKNAVLPAFSKFSGHSIIKPKKGDLVFMLVNERIVPL